MKTTKFLAMTFAAMALSAGFTACTDDDDDTPSVPTFNENDYHFDLMMSVGGTTGMSTTDITDAIVRSVSVADIENPDNTIGISGQGVSIWEDLNSEAIIKGAYYYEVAPRKNTWYGKYSIGGSSFTTESRYAFGNITFLDRQYTHAWTDDNTLVIIGADRSVSSRGSNPALTNTLQWARLTDNGGLKLEAEGTLDMPAATTQFKDGGITAFSTSGLAAYRQSDNTIIYFFVDKATKKPTQGIFAAFIDANTMEIMTVVHDERVDEMCGTSYGELGQDKMFFDENEDLYIPCGKKVADAAASSAQTSYVLRVKKGAYDIDRDYCGASDINAKVYTADYLGGGKAILFAYDPVKAGLSSTLEAATSSDWNQNTFCGFYYLYDIATGMAEMITDNGQPFAPSCGAFSDRVAVLNGKAYIGTCPKEPTPSRIYIYDIKTGQMKQGATIEGGYYFNRLSVVKNN